MILFNYPRGIRIILIKISGHVLSGGFRVVGAEAEYFLVPTLCVGMQLYQQGLPRRAWEPGEKTITAMPIFSFLRSA